MEKLNFANLWGQIKDWNFVFLTLKHAWYIALAFIIRDVEMSRFLRNLLEATQCFPYLITDWCRINGSLCEPSQSCNICTSHLRSDGNWPFFHCMVFRLWGHIYQIHPRSQEGATHQICCLSLHGSWIPFSNPLGWHLCMIMSFSMQ